MKKIILFGLLFICSYSTVIHAQQYEASIEKHREHYKADFLTDENSPLVKEDLPYLQFYKPNSSYLVTATFTRIVDSTGFDMKTHSGKPKPYVVYGRLDFTLQKKTHSLYIYQSITLREKEGFEDYLFVPFNDVTNGDETYGGGRYLDFRMKDIFNNKLIIDFNKAYNPYCAFKGGYSCPIPPKENKLPIKIEAGEKRFGKEIED